jgi:hypothetical protein
MNSRYLNSLIVKSFVATLALILLYGEYNVAFSQFSITGQVSGADIYTNPEPDSIVQAVAAHLTNYPGGSFSIDVDQNRIMDFTISASGGGGLGGGGGAASIHSLNPTTKIMTHEETSVGYPGDAYYTVNVADTINFGQTIDNNSIFDHTGGYFWSSNYGYSSGASVHSWNSTEDHYVGFMMVPNVDTLYGWIRLNVNSPSGSCIITLKDFACNINEFASVIEPENKYISVFPNPATDYFNISIGTNELNNKISIYNSIGKIVDTFVVDKKITINISEYSPGVYYLKFNNKPDVKKVVVY